jgi:NADH-quinone oxidoreductase subunit E
VARALSIGDTVKRIDGTEVPLSAPWLGQPQPARGKADAGPQPGAGLRPDETGVSVQEAPAKPVARPAPQQPEPGTKPAMLSAARASGADDLKRINGIGPKLEALLNSMGVFHFDQIASWGADEIAWVDANLEGFKGRVSRDGWVTQAQAFASPDATRSETLSGSRGKLDGE